MNTLKILGSDLVDALAYISPAIGSKTSAQQEAVLVHLEVLNETTLRVQAQSNSLVIYSIIPVIEGDETLPKFLIDFSILDRYARNNSKDKVFELDLSEVEDKDIVSLTVGNKFIGQIATIPIDAYEPQLFSDIMDIATIETKQFNSLVDMSCQFANIKQDTQDYMQILAEDNKLIFFTTDGTTIAHFSMDLDLDEELDLTVRASGLKKLKRFSSKELNIGMTEDQYFMILQEDELHLIALVLHSDPPYTYQELEEEVKQDDYVLSWTIPEMLTALKNVEGSSTNGTFTFEFLEEDLLQISSQDLRSNITKVDVNILLNSFDDILLKEQYTIPIALFRKLSNVAKKQGKVDLNFSLAQVENEQFIENMDAEGIVGDINYKISFGVDSACQV
tara:strand:- start:4495 stop:5667 length:1173 start_codon:yes stop_codon:yes gene_type:complete